MKQTISPFGKLESWYTFYFNQDLKKSSEAAAEMAFGRVVGNHIIDTRISNLINDDQIPGSLSRRIGRVEFPLRNKENIQLNVAFPIWKRFDEMGFP